MKPLKESEKRGPLKPWSDAEAAELVNELIKVVGKEPLLQIPIHSISSDGTIDAIVTGREYLQQGLQRVFAQYHFEARWQDKPSRTKLTVKLESIEKAAKRLYAALGLKSVDSEVLARIDPQDLKYSLTTEAALMAEEMGGFTHHPPMTFKVGETEATDWFSTSQLRDILFGVKQLEQWAAAARKRMSQRPIPKPSERHKGDVAETKLIGDLAGLWIACYKAYPKFSRASGDSDPGGPFLRFLEACYIAANVPYASRDALLTKAKRTLGTSRKVSNASVIAQH